LGGRWVERVRHCTSGSLVISLLGVREMCAAVLDKKAATRGRRWLGRKGGWR
jgi:hypothetical protein